MMYDKKKKKTNKNFIFIIFVSEKEVLMSLTLVSRNVKKLLVYLSAL